MDPVAVVGAGVLPLARELVFRNGRRLKPQFIKKLISLRDNFLYPILQGREYLRVNLERVPWKHELFEKLKVKGNFIAY